MNQDNKAIKVVNFPLTAGDAGPYQIIADPAAGVVLSIVSFRINLTTSAAQSINFRNTSGNPSLFTLAASSPIGSNYGFGPLVQDGVDMLPGQGLQGIASGAGNAGNIYVEYFIKQGITQ